MLIRSINHNADDFRAIAKLHAKSWKENYKGMLSDDYLAHEVDQERLEYWLKFIDSPQDNQVILLAEQHNELVGFICFYIDKDAELGTEVDNLHVRSDFKTQGIGKLLMHHTAKWLLNHKNSHGIYLFVLDKNSKAQQFYEKIKGQRSDKLIKKERAWGTISLYRYAWKNPQELFEVTT